MNGNPHRNIIITAVSQNNYTYTAVIPKVTPCENKKLKCEIKGYGNPYTETSMISGEFSPGKSKFYNNIVFKRDCRLCSTIKWRINIDTGECEVKYQLNFLNGTNVTSVSEVLTNNNYNTCSIQAQSIKVSTYVYGNKSGVYQLLTDTTTSEPVDFVDEPCPSTTTPTPTSKGSTTTGGSNSCQEELYEKEEQLQEKTTIIIVSTVINSVFFILTLTILVGIKSGRITFGLVRKGIRKTEEKVCMFLGVIQEVHNG